MASFRIYQIDAFASEVFRGNPAAVCPLKEWISDDLMQKIAAENNLSETAFYVPQEDGFYIRWFTPTTEVELCGHATLASAFVLFHHERYAKEEIHFYCKVGMLKVYKSQHLITLDFPASPISQTEVPEKLGLALGVKPLEYYVSGGFGMAVFASEKEVSAMSPDFNLLKALEPSVLIATAKGENCDFVSRVFGPKVGIEEDPVTGSAHTRLVPYWSRIFNKENLSAVQISSRRGCLQCEYKGDRVLMSGEAVTYMIGEIFV